MAIMSKAEQTFRARFPHTRVTVQQWSPGSSLKTVTVYAGDYICAEGLSKQDAFRRSLEYLDAGMIQPDPEEVAAQDIESEA